MTAPYWHSTSPSNFSGYKDADDLVTLTRTEPDPTKRAKAYADLQKKIAQDSPGAFIISCSRGRW